MFNDSRSIDVNADNDFETEVNEWRVYLLNIRLFR